MTYFHFSIGPVQEFVNQARRTNDFWGGSFLLSWLAGVAMLCAQRQGAVPVYPLPPENYLDWIEGKFSPDSDNMLAKVGAIPNRFCMLVDDKFDPTQVETSVRAAWLALCQHTRRSMFGTLPFSAIAQTVWQRQIESQGGGLWEILWVMTESEKPDAFDPRKAWRSHARRQEGAPFCALMAGWQALPLSEAERQAAKANNFRLNRDDGIDESTENLCAPALIKRHFAKCFADFNDDSLGIKGWQLPPNAPSTHYMAAAPWLATMLAKIEPQSLADHEALAISLQVGNDEAQTQLRMVQNAKKAHQHRDDCCRINAPFWFDNEVANAKLAVPEATKALLASLNSLYKIVGAKPAKHYALMLMDGDQVGAMGKRAPQLVARALRQFTLKVPAIVDEHSGFLVYAGGDDVLALLPSHSALSCAVQIRQSYLAEFADAMAINPMPELPRASISCALLYAHSKTPLTLLLGAAHELLDHVAKEQCGRDSLALQVWKRSGLNLTFAQKWQHLFDSTQHTSLPDLLQMIAQDGAQSDQASQFSQRFFQRAHALLQELAPLYQRSPDSSAHHQLNEACHHLLREEYRHGLPKRCDEARTQREQRIAHLVNTLMHLAAPLPDSLIIAPQAALLPLLQFLLENINGMEGYLP